MGQPDQEYLRAIATCTCGGQKFELRIYSCGNDRAHCLACNKAWEGWEAVGQSEGSVSGGDSSVGEGRDEPSNVVPAKRKA